MMNHSQTMSQSQQVMNMNNTQNSQMMMNQMINASHMMKMNTQNSVNQTTSFNNLGGGSYVTWQPRNNKNWKLNRNKNNGKEYDVVSGSNVANAGGVAGGYCCPPTLNKSQQQNRLKPRRHILKKKFKSAPFAPRNTTSFLIRAKKAGGIASLVSPCPVTPAVLTTPIFSPSKEVLVDMAKEEWGVDGYGTMKGLIRLVRSPGNEEEGGSGESDVEDHLEVERKLDHDLSRFEMINPNNNGSDSSSYVLENRVDDQDTHIARMKEENWMLKERLFLMEREFGKLRTRLQSLEMRKGGVQGFVEQVVGNDSRNESGCRGYEVLEENSVDNKESGNGVGVGVDVAADVHVEDGISKIDENRNGVIEDDDDVNEMVVVNQRVM